MVAHEVAGGEARDVAGGGARDGSTNVEGLYVVGDLSGVPLLKLSVNAGVKVVRKLAEGDLGKSAAGSRHQGRGGEW